MAAPGATSRRVIGRILSLGFPMPGPSIDNYDFITAPAFFDYDALVVDPRALCQLVGGVIAGTTEAATYSGRPVRPRREAPDEVSLADALLRRREETAMALASGAAVVCFAHPAVVHRVEGAGEIDDYYWLPRSDGLTYAPPQLVPGEGSRVHVVDYGHPLASFVASQSANIGYRARIDMAKMPEGSAAFALSEGGAAVGVEAPSTRGRIILLPALARAPSGEDRYVLSDELQAGIRRALGMVAEGRPPPWVAGYPLPGLEERAVALEEARRASDEVRTRLEEAERAHDELARFYRLLWQEGAVGLEDVVVEALRLVGFEVYARERSELELRAGETRVFVEVEASERAVDMAAHHRLRQRIERAIERAGEAPRGLLLVNGQRLQPPGERGQQVTDSLRVAAETMRYCIATTGSLYEAVRAQLSGEEAAVAGWRTRVVGTDGLVEE